MPYASVGRINLLPSPAAASSSAAAAGAALYAYARHGPARGSRAAGLPRLAPRRCGGGSAPECCCNMRQCPVLPARLPAVLMDDASRATLRREMKVDTNHWAAVAENPLRIVTAAIGAFAVVAGVGIMITLPIAAPLYTGAHVRRSKTSVCSSHEQHPHVSFCRSHWPR